LSAVLESAVAIPRPAAARRPAPGGLRLSELLGALSHALDVAEGQPEGHSVRCCWIGMQIGQALRLPAHELGDLYYTLLLKDLGGSSNAARVSALYQTDDLAFKHDHKVIGGSLPKVLRFVLSHTGQHAGLAERIQGIVNVAWNGGDIATELIVTRCERGADIARRLGWQGQGDGRGGRRDPAPCARGTVGAGRGRIPHQRRQRSCLGRNPSAFRHLVRASPCRDV
jgi:hypothetical protein